MSQIGSQKEEYYKQLGVAPGVPTMKGAYGDPENTKRGYNSIIDTLGNHDVPQGWIQTRRPNTIPNTNPSPPVSWNDPSNPDDPQAGYGYIPNDTTKEETFFYHSDHLGSTSYITDDKANITQYDAYLPYGELLVDEHSSSEELPYKFNGKEMDEETGLYYYGARYMNPMASIWYGVDPLAGDYPIVSAYTYCAANPLKYIDPDGQYILFINGLRLWHGNMDQKTFYGGFKIHKTDVYNYWSTEKNNFGRKADIAAFYKKVYNENNVGFTSGSSYWNSSARDRELQGMKKAELFHKMVQEGKIKLDPKETIKIISHSQGAAHAAGFAERLMSYKDKLGNPLYHIIVMEYICPHQPTDITHPKGPLGIQFSHPSDAVASDSPWWMPNGGTSYGKIQGIDEFVGGDIFGGNGQPKNTGATGNMGGHAVTDNDEFIK